MREESSAGERVWEVPPLAPPDRLEPCEHLIGYEAIGLFFARARTVEPSFSLNDHIAPAVVEICRRLDGIPLAIGYPLSAVLRY